MLGEIQKALFDRALAFRQEHTRTIDSLDEFREFFTPKSKDVDHPEIHGGFALCHFTDEAPEMDEVLKELKVTPRCIPLEGDAEPGTCLFTGQPSARRAVFAKAY